MRVKGFLQYPLSYTRCTEQRWIREEKQANKECDLAAERRSTLFFDVFWATAESLFIGSIPAFDVFSES